MYSYLFYFKILLPMDAQATVEITPLTITIQFILFPVLVYKGVMPPKTRATKVSLISASLFEIKQT